MNRSNLVPLVRFEEIDSQVRRFRAGSDAILFFDQNPTASISFPLQTLEAEGYCRYIITMNAESYQVGAKEVLASGIWHVISDEFLPSQWDKWGIAARNKAAIGAAIDKASATFQVPTTIDAAGVVTWEIASSPRNNINSVWDYAAGEPKGGIGSVVIVGNDTYIVTHVIVNYNVKDCEYRRVGTIVNDVVLSDITPATIILEGDKSVYDNLTGIWSEGAFAFDDTPRLIASISTYHASEVKSDSNGQYSKWTNVSAGIGWFLVGGNQTWTITTGVYRGQLLNGGIYPYLRRFKSIESYGFKVYNESWELPEMGGNIGGFTPFVITGLMLKKSNVTVNGFASVFPSIVTLIRILDGGESWQQTE